MALLRSLKPENGALGLPLPLRLPFTSSPPPSLFRRCPLSRGHCSSRTCTLTSLSSFWETPSSPRRHHRGAGNFFFYNVACDATAVSNICGPGMPIRSQRDIDCARNERSIPRSTMRRLPKPTAASSDRRSSRPERKKSNISYTVASTF